VVARHITPIPSLDAEERDCLPGSDAGEVEPVMKRLMLCALAVLAFWIPETRPSQVTANVIPSQVVQDLLETVKRIKKADADNNVVLTAEDERQNQELSRKANRLLDLEGISAYALVDHWNANPQDRKAFVSLFTELLEKVAYTNTGKFLKDLIVSINKEKVLQDKAMVYTSVVHEKEGRVDIDFKLHQAGAAWVVEDVLLDGVSLVRNLRTQCQKIIRENSMQELLARMRKKIAERDKEDLKEITGRN
jgi:phospholipid transport system substrate-binding protein